MSPFDFKYDPEDLESLLLHKRFHELYPEEKSFVLQYISSEEEYTSMRATLLKVQEVNDDEYISARPESKELLMKLFEEEKQTSGFKVWLNGNFLPLFANRQSAISLSLAVLASVVFALIFLFQDPSSARMAMLNEDKTDRLEFPKERKNTEIESPFREEENSRRSSEQVEPETFVVEDQASITPPQSDESLNLNNESQNPQIEGIIVKEESTEPMLETDDLAVESMADQTEGVPLEEIEISAEKSRSAEVTIASKQISSVQAESVTTLSGVQDEAFTNLSTDGSMFEVNITKAASTSSNVRSQSSLIESLYTAY